MPLDKYVHRCVIQTGDLADNKHAQKVDPSDYEYREECPNCGQRLVTGRQLLAHIYGELLGPDQ